MDEIQIEEIVSDFYLKVRNLHNTNKMRYSIFVCTVFYTVPTCFGAVSRHLQGANTVSMKLTAIK
jgi:hypothetical protein